MKALFRLFILAIGCFCNRSYAQSALEPCDLEFMAGYYVGVDRIIDDAVGRPAELAITTFPSFHAESGVRLVGADIYFVDFKSSFWTQGALMEGKSGRSRTHLSKPRIKTSVHVASLSQETAGRIARTYAVAIANARKSNSIGLDGISYHFSTPKAGCAEAWSPDAGSHNARLVELFELLSKHARLSKPRQLQSSEQSIVLLLSAISGH